MNDPFPGRSPPEISQAELFRRLRADDESALEIVLREHWVPLVTYLSRSLTSPDAAEDVAQRTFLRFWDRRRRWSAEGSLRGLLFRIARNLAISEQRRRGARRRAIDRLAEHGDRPRQPTPLDAVENDELGCAIERAIEKLPERRREAFVLRCVHGLSYREIADVMDISQQTVANQISRALTTLRRSLAHLLDEC